MVSRCLANCIPLHLQLCLNSKKFISTVCFFYIFFAASPILHLLIVFYELSFACDLTISLIWSVFKNWILVLIALMLLCLCRPVLVLSCCTFIHFLTWCNSVRPAKFRLTEMYFQWEIIVLDIHCSVIFWYFIYFISCGRFQML